MSEACSHDCSICKSDCNEKKPDSLLAAPHASTHVKKVIGVVSGKGGVGKSLVTSLLAAGMARRDAAVGILDADITGPSIPKAFGITGHAHGTDEGILPAFTSGGMKIMSINLLLTDASDPVVWRGPVIAGAVKQFWTDVLWGDLDYLFIDMPPGTGDVPLTVFQSLPVDGIVVVASPQELVGMIVEKAVKMAGMLNISVLALVENMSYFQCPDCSKRYEIFGKSHIDEVAEAYAIQTVARIPIDPAFAIAVDAGAVERLTTPYLDAILDIL